MKFYVRTTGERKYDYDLEYEELIDRNHEPVESFIKQLKIISDADSILLEDDLVLCKDFKNRIEEVIKKYPDKVINFYTSPERYFTTHETNLFVYNQCTYYPKGVAKQIAEKMEEEYKIRKLPYDTLESSALNKLGMSHVVYRPCLVQRIDMGSLISNSEKGGSRVSLYFVDWLEKYGIDYKEAIKPENIERLKFEKEEFIKRRKIQ